MNTANTHTFVDGRNLLPNFVIIDVLCETFFRLIAEVSTRICQNYHCVEPIEYNTAYFLFIYTV